MSGKKSGAKAAPAGGAAKAGGGKASARKGGASAKAPAQPADKNILFPANKKNFRIGNSVQPTRDLSRFVKWPRNVRLQRQKKVIYDRLKVPPSINQFSHPLDKAEAAPLFALLKKYEPEDKETKTARLEAEGKAKAAGGDGRAKTKPLFVKSGLNHVTTLVEEKKAQLVVIASDVNPVELVLWLPALCRKMGVPYAIVNNKGRLGSLVHLKKTAVVALTEVRAEDASALEKVRDLANAKFANNRELSRRWGGGKMGLKTNAALKKRKEAMEVEAKKRANL